MFLHDVFHSTFSFDMHTNTRTHFGTTMAMMQVKTGPFAEHSNALWGISSVAEWTKVNSGLIKMYKAEVCICTVLIYNV